MTELFTHTGRFVLRQPAYCISEFLRMMNDDEVLMSAYRKEDFGRSILWVSKDLYNEYSKYLGGRLSESEAKRMKLTLFKYLSRMSTRCIPFGGFASIEVGDIGEKTELDDNTPIQSHVALDSLYEHELFTLVNEELKTSPSYLYSLNGSIIAKGGYMHFVSNIGNGKYEFFTLPRNPLITQLMRRMNRPMNFDSVCHTLAKSFEAEEDDIRVFVTCMIRDGLLIPDCTPEAMGEAWICKAVDMFGVNNSSDLVIQKAMDSMINLAYEQETESASALVLSLRNAVPEDKCENLKNIVNVVSYRKAIPTLDQRAVQKVLATIPFFSMIMSPLMRHSNLLSFAKDFQSRYEMQSIPLMEALDPEIGIGYGGSVMPGRNPLLAGMVYKTPDMREGLTLSAFESMLFEKIKSSQDTDANSITLTDNDVKNLPSQIDLLPGSMSAVFDIIQSSEGMPTISGLHFSGISATCLIGRFTPSHTKLDDLAKDIASHEDEYYHEKGILAEINLLPTIRSGNVNCRTRFRKHRICPVMPSDNNDIPLSRLMVSVKNGKVVLTDKKTEETILPRLSTAHNHYAETDVIYQFLGDIQLQDELTTLMFTWGRLRNIYRHFPRVYYKDIIISFEEWQCNTADFMEGKHISPSKIRRWMEENKMPRYLKYINGDNELFIDSSSDICLQTLANEIKKRKKIRILEYLLPEGKKNTTEEFHHNQIIMPVLKNKNR